MKTSQLSVDFLIVLIFLLCECKFLWSVCCGNCLSLWRFAVRQCKTDFKSHFLRSFFPGCQTLCWQNQMDFCFLSEFWEISSDTHIRYIFVWMNWWYLKRITSDNHRLHLIYSNYFLQPFIRMWICLESIFPTWSGETSVILACSVEFLQSFFKRSEYPSNHAWPLVSPRIG